MSDSALCKKLLMLNYICTQLSELLVPVRKKGKKNSSVGNGQSAAACVQSRVKVAKEKEEKSRGS